MIVVVLDTNILSSLIAPHGKEARIAELVEQGFLSVATTSAILAEYQQVLSRPKFKFALERAASPASQGWGVALG